MITPTLPPPHRPPRADSDVDAQRRSTEQRRSGGHAPQQDSAHHPQGEAESRRPVHLPARERRWLGPVHLWCNCQEWVLESFLPRGHTLWSLMLWVMSLFFLYLFLFTYLEQEHNLMLWVKSLFIFSLYLFVYLTKTRMWFKVLCSLSCFFFYYYHFLIIFFPLSYASFAVKKKRKKERNTYYFLSIKKTSSLPRRDPVPSRHLEASSAQGGGCQRAAAPGDWRDGHALAHHHLEQGWPAPAPQRPRHPQVGGHQAPPHHPARWDVGLFLFLFLCAGPL